MKKNFVLLTLLFSFNTMYSKENEKYFKLESRFIRFLDGIPGCLDGKAIYEIQLVRKMIFNLRHEGIFDKNSNDKLTYKGQKVTILEMVVKEEEFQNCPELKQTLQETKKKFINRTLGFMERIKDGKKAVINLMKVSCQKRNINEKDTVLLEWGNTNGNEEAVFNERMKSFKEFDKFLTHVDNFLGDLLKSCPKGFEEYKTKVKPQIQRKKNNN